MTCKTKKKKIRKKNCNGVLRDRLEYFGFSSYSEYLQSDIWREFRKRYIASELPNHCIACHYPVFDLHHVSYLNVVEETFYDVVPLCKRCHSDVHNQTRHLREKLARPDLVLQTIWKWDDNQREQRFSFYLSEWKCREQQPPDESDFLVKREVAKQKKAELKENRKTEFMKKMDVELRSNPQYMTISKLSRHHSKVRDLLKLKYSHKDIANTFSVPVQYVTNYIEKYGDTL